jgi:hypothetical protein
MPHLSIRRRIPRGPLSVLSFVLAAAVVQPPVPAHAQAQSQRQAQPQREAPAPLPAALTHEGWTRPPAAIERAVLAPRHLNVTLTNASPDGRYFLREQSEGLPSMASFAREHLWLGGLQLDRARTAHATSAHAGLSACR